MTEKLQFRRGQSSALPGSPQLDVGEPTYLTDINTVAIGDGSANPPKLLTDVGNQILRNKLYVDQIPVSTGSSNAYAVTLNPAPTAYENGLVISFKPNHANTGAVSLDVNGLGAVTILDYNGNNLTGGEFVVNAPTEVVHDGTNFRLTSVVSGGTTGESNTASNLGGGTGVFGQKSGVELQFKSLVAGNNVSLSSNSDEITIDATASSSGGSAGGAVNTAVDAQQAYSITTSMVSSGVTVGSGDRALVISAHVTNIDANENDGWVSSQVNINGGGEISLGHEIPLPGGSAVELLKKPKVLEPGDTLDFQADANSRAQVIVTYINILSDSDYFNSGVDLTTTTITDLHIATADSIVESILIANDAANSNKIDVVWTDGSNVVQAYLARNMAISNNSTVEILENTKYLPNSHKIRVQSKDNSSRLEAFLSGKIK